MTGPEHYRRAEKLLKEIATSGPEITARDTWQHGKHSCTPFLPSLPLAPVMHTPGAVFSIPSPAQSLSNATSQHRRDS
jgi:hypothetical protein